MKEGTPPLQTLIYMEVNPSTQSALTSDKVAYLGSASGHAEAPGDLERGISTQLQS